MIIVIIIIIIIIYNDNSNNNINSNINNNHNINNSSNIHLNDNGLLVFDTWNDRSVKIKNLSDSKVFKINKSPMNRSNFFDCSWFFNILFFIYIIVICYMSENSIV